MNLTKSTPCPVVSKAGMTLIELTAVITVLLIFLGMGFIGVRAWKVGSDRANCVLNIYHTQEAVRSFSNLHGFNPGQTLAGVDLEQALFGADGMLGTRPACPASGQYVTSGNTIPAFGNLYLNCSLAGSARHVPDSAHRW